MMIKKIACLLMLAGCMALFTRCGGGSTEGAPSPAASVLEFVAVLSGDSEVPPVISTAAGTLLVDIDEAAGTLTTILEASNIVAPRAAHIHLGAEGVNGPVIFGLYDSAVDGDLAAPVQKTLTEANFNVVGGLTTFSEAINAIKTGRTYANIHTEANPAGEIRGQILP